jgi:transcriptional regulator with XRE-family HTH domain
MNLCLPELLKQCRETAGLSQEELAERLLVDRSYISKVEHGKYHNLTYDFVKLWGLATNCSELISMDIVGVGNEGWKKLMTYRLFESQIRSGLEMLEISS